MICRAARAAASAAALNVLRIDGRVFLFFARGDSGNADRGAYGIGGPLLALWSLWHPLNIGNVTIHGQV